MNHDAGFLGEMLAHPDDIELRLIYADYLEERGDPRGEFLRLEAALAEMPAADARRPGLLARLRQLGGAISTDWLARLDRVPVENCDLRFRYVCPKRWENLEPTDDNRVRHCDTCDQNVYYCRSVADARGRALGGQCVAIDSRVERAEGDLGVRPRDTSNLFDLRRLAPNGRIRQPRLGEPVAPRRDDGQRFERGDTVTVVSGKWQGTRGLVERVSGTRAKVQLFLKARKRVVVDLDELEAD